jgi:hypothetical protein
MDNFDASTETADAPEINFGKEIAKIFAVSAAMTAGTVAGFIAVGLTVNKISEARKARKEKKEKKTKLTVVK